VASLRAAEPRAIRAGADDYPAGLRDLADPPEALHILGGPLPSLERAIAIVGARAATPYGLEVAHRLAADLARLGFVIVSGLARGIDAAAHTGALDAGGRTVAVLPGGLDQIAPAHHTALARRIQESGTLASEHPAGTPVYRGSFLTRNRLIAALSTATVVVEAAERSGALSTAATARRLTRVVLAVPGDVDRETSRGCHALLRNGAHLCEGAADVIAALEEAAGKDAPAKAHLRRRSGGMGRFSPRLRASRKPGIGGARPGVSEPAQDAPASGGEKRPIPPLLPATRTDAPSATNAVLAGLSREPRLVEDVAQRAGLTLPETLAALLALQWSGLARALPGQRWARR